MIWRNKATTVTGWGFFFFWKSIEKKKTLRDTLTFREKMTFHPQILNEQIPFLSIFIYLSLRSSRFTLRFLFFFLVYFLFQMSIKSLTMQSCDEGELQQRDRWEAQKAHLDVLSGPAWLWPEPSSLYIRVAVFITDGHDVRDTTKPAPSGHRRVTTQLLRPHPLTATD